MKAFGAGRLGDAPPRAYVRAGDRAINLYTLTRDDVFANASLNAFLARGPDAWRAVRALVDETDEHAMVPVDALEMQLPVEIGDYVDMYAGIHHATNLGKMFRPESEPLLPNWRRMPVGYHGRAGTVVVSRTDITRPHGQIVDGDDVQLAPTRQLDIELELGFVVGVGSERGQPVPIERFAQHVFGVVLVNDWSARDIQAFEYQPLGPFLGKSFATSISPWIVPLDELAWTTTAQDPPPAPYLQTTQPWIPDMHLEVLLETERMRAAGELPEVVSRVDAGDALYWSLAQQLAHATVNGALLRTGDLFATGTLSGPDPRTQGGSFIELTWRGTAPLRLANGEQRSFLEDGDRVVLRGPVGEVEGTVR